MTTTTDTGETKRRLIDDDENDQPTADNPPRYPHGKSRNERRTHRSHRVVDRGHQNQGENHVKSPNDQATYVFDEAIADRLRLMVYNFQATIDELLARTRVEPVASGDVGFNETCFWETHAELRERLNAGLEPEDEEKALF